MTARALFRPGVAVAAAALACAACSGSAPSPRPSPTRTLTTVQATYQLVACFVSHDLIPFSVLNNGKNSSPPYDYSTWYRNGKVLGNELFGTWYRVDNDVDINGQTLDQWVHSVEANRKAWPVSICGPLPR